MLYHWKLSVEPYFTDHHLPPVEASPVRLWEIRAHVAWGQTSRTQGRFITLKTIRSQGLSTP